LGDDAAGGPSYTVITRRTLTTRRYEKRWIDDIAKDAFEILYLVHFLYRL
jgi:hypothetical protein